MCTAKKLVFSAVGHQQEVISAYLEGRMSRRTLARRLAAAGISLGAATAYAHLLKPAAAGARALGDQHFDASVEILDDDLDRVIDRGGLKVRATADRELTLYTEVYLLRPDHSQYPRAVVGTYTFDFSGAGTLKQRIALAHNPPYSLKAVKKERHNYRRARFQVVSVGTAAGTSTFTDIETVKT